MKTSVRVEVLARAGGKCESCALPPKRFCLHHRNRKRGGEHDNPENLLGLCSKCHGRVHREEGTGSITYDRHGREGRQPKTFRLEVGTRDRLARLAAKLQISQAGVVDMLVREKWAQVENEDLWREVKELRARLVALEGRNA